jgi:polysaccharide transporter, PST family
MNLLLKGLSVGLTAAGVLVTAVAPLLFQVAFRGKYAGGLAVLPWALTYCAWFGMTMIAQKYLWCVERASLASLAMGLGLAVNVSLNVVLLPRCGLLGAVLATAAANLIALMSILLLSRRLGLRVDRSTWSALLLPMAVCLGPAPGVLVLLAVALDVAAGGPLLSPAEKRELADGTAYYLAKLRLLNPGRREAGRI